MTESTTDAFHRERAFFSALVEQTMTRSDEGGYIMPSTSHLDTGKSTSFSLSNSSAIQVATFTTIGLCKSDLSVPSGLSHPQSSHQETSFSSIMYLSRSVTTLLFLGTLAAPAIALPAADPADSEVFLDDVLAAEGSTNATIDAVEASAVGKARVRNACPFPIVLLRCYQPHAGQPAGCNKLEHLAANGGTHTETYDPNANNGISLKVRRQDGDFSKNILQFEYTNRGPDLHPRINYDISEVNSDVNDFWRKNGAGGFTLTTSDPQCFHKHCAPPCKTCKGVFTQPENGTPHNCGYGKDIGMTVCG